MALEQWQGFVFLVLATGLTTLVGGCVSTPEGTAGYLGGTPEGYRLDDLVLVDCLLPGQIRQLGTRMTYLSPRRHVKATQSDCAVRGGEFVRFDRSDYKTALRELLPKAKAGDVVSQTYVGEIYEKGWGLPGPDYAAAARWYRAAAETGHRPAQTSLGTLYERGLGVPKDRLAALNWYRKAVGIGEDKVIFESQLETERAAFEREIALRNRVAAELRRQLQQARRPQPPALGTKTTATGTTATKTAATKTTATVPVPVAREDLERVAESLRREAASEEEQVQKELHAVEELKKAEGLEKTRTTSDSKKAAQMGKLELTLRMKSDALADNRQRLTTMVQ